jgi:glucose-6-phosphate 1-dehydrogenase
LKLGTKETEAEIREIAAPDPVAFVIFGATGDLAKRMLLPALYRLFAEGALSDKLAIVGVARRELTDDAFRDLVHDAVTGAHPLVDGSHWLRFRDRLYYVSADFKKEGDYRRIGRLLNAVEERHETRGNRVFYLAVPPSTFEGIISALGDMELVHRDGGDGRGWNRVIIEKPFGHDEASAERLDALIDRVVGEHNIFRLDHYLGKETVQNMLVFRFANTVFEPIWNRRYVDNVQITFSEDIGIEGRGRFYEEVGVVRDVLQSHVFQLLAIVAMEPPTVFDAEEFRNEKAKVLRAIPPVRPEDAVRGQYGPGTVRGHPVPGYREEEGFNPDSNTPTYVAMRLQIENWRWAGVPFYLRAGKRMAEKDTEVVVVFRQPPLRLFKDYDMSEMGPNVLILNTAQDERISLGFGARVPGHRRKIRTVPLDFSYDSVGEAEHPPYEHLLLEALRGNQRFMPRRDEVELQWAVVDPLLRHWEDHAPRSFPNYPAGSWGPQAANRLLERDGRRWRGD